jgi:negative regulator of sigma E activity
VALPPASLAPTEPLEFTPAGAATADALRDTCADIVVVEHAAAPRPSIVDAGPSAQALLERAAALGPMRATFQSFALPTDPVLGAKMQPHVAERRARFRHVVKATLGACVALCALSLVVSALSGGEAHASSSPTPNRATASKAVTSVEKLDGPTRAKAQRETSVRPGRRAAASTPRHR